MNQSLRRNIWSMVGVFVVVTVGVTGYFWKVLQDLDRSSKALADTQKVLSRTTDLERHLMAEQDIRVQIQRNPAYASNLKGMSDFIDRDLMGLKRIETDPGLIKELNTIESKWKVARDPAHYQDLLYLSRKVGQKKKELLEPLEINAAQAKRTSQIALAVYSSVMIAMLLALGLKVGTSLIKPIVALGEKMDYFQKGQYDPNTSRNPNTDELAVLENNFYDMARRINKTVSDLRDVDKSKVDMLSLSGQYLRGPISAIKGALGQTLTLKNELGPESTANLRVAEREADKLFNLITNILDLQQADTKQLDLKKAWCSLDEVMMEAVTETQSHIQESGAIIDFHAPDPSYTVCMDRDRVKQIINNLLHNAAKHSPKGGVVTVGYEPHDSGVRVSITNQGPDIDKNHQKRIFDRFRMRDATKSEMRTKGPGLGLALCKAIVEKHGGEIGVESGNGEGTTFYFTLPEASPEKGHAVVAV